MWSFSSLPTPLLALLFALPVFSATPTTPPLITPYDPFRAIAAHVSKQPEPPVCCLRPPPSSEKSEEEVLLSFEEWKAKQMASVLQEQAASTHSVPNPGQHPEGAANVSQEPNSSWANGEGAFTTLPLDQTEVTPPNAPYFRIPITDRFNYASTDCSARVHAVHKSAKSASNILSSKRDKYMLTPCAETRQFIIVELCDDIRIDTVQLANFEFFSGVFKDFAVRVAKTYSTNPEDWTDAGTYRAKNVRGVQSFHPPTTLSDFYRFIRIDFQSHYGTEYYCPLSLLRVYGLTHLEHWKWDIWEAESKAKKPAVEELSVAPVDVGGQVHVSIASEANALPKAPVPDTPATASPEENIEVGSVDALGRTHSVFAVYSSGGSVTPPDTSPDAESSLSAPASSKASTANAGVADSTIGPTSSKPAVTSPVVLQNVKTQTDAPTQKTTMTTSIAADIQKPLDTMNDNSRPPSTDSLYSTHSSPSGSSQLSSVTVSSISVVANAPNTPTQQQPQKPPSSAAPPPPPPPASSSVSLISNQSAQSVRPASGTTTGAHALTVGPPPPPIASSASGESIYRTIMNRLTALETNTTLYARFVEEHTASVREMLRRLGEDLGRLEGIGRAQEQTYQRSVAEFQQRQRRLELEHSELLSRIVRLTDDIMLEKRLGIAQLCLLLTVLVFMTLTRGSRNEPLQASTSTAAVDMRSRTSSMIKGWPGRPLNLSSEWVNKGKSVSAGPGSPSSVNLNGHDHEPSEFTSRPPNTNSVDSTPRGVGVQADMVPKSKRSHPGMNGYKVGALRTPSSARQYASIPRHYSPSRHPATATSTALRDTTRPVVQRALSATGGAMTQSFSMGMIGPVPRSARRWARTAHIHEVPVKGGHGNGRKQNGASRTESERSRTSSNANTERETEEDVFGPLRPGFELDGAKRRVSGSGSVVEASASEGDGWEDTDVEAEASPQVERTVGQIQRT